MGSTTSIIVKAVHFLFWVIFIGLCIKTGSLLFSAFVSLFFNPQAANDLYLGFNLNEVFQYSKGFYIALLLCVIFLEGLKAYIAYLVIKIFMKLDLNSPFQHSLAPIISKISFVALITGLLALFTTALSTYLLSIEVMVPNEWSTEEILFFAAILYIVAVIFKKGTQLQTDNDLTI